MKTPQEITDLLARARRGNARAIDRLLPVVYAELRSLAARYLRNERSYHTLQPTALVHEAYLRLVGAENLECDSRDHFYRVAAQAMRRVLVDHARKHRAAKRAGRWQKASLRDADELTLSLDVDLLALDEALTALAAFDARKSRIVELRFFAGLTTEETARVLGVTTRTIERDWRLARAWLYRELRTDANA